MDGVYETTSHSMDTERFDSADLVEVVVVYS